MTGGAPKARRPSRRVLGDKPKTFVVINCGCGVVQNLCNAISDKSPSIEQLQYDISVQPGFADYSLLCWSNNQFVCFNTVKGAFPWIFSGRNDFLGRFPYVTGTFF